MLLALALTLFVSRPIDVETVLTIMSHVPAVEDQRSPHYAEVGHWDRIGAAREIAEAIAAEAPDEDTGALMAVYAAWEGGMQRCVPGDHGLALGPWQLHGVPTWIACEPRAAARAWLRLARWSKMTCRFNPEPERLAALESGACDRARKKAAARYDVAQDLLGWAHAEVVFGPSID